MIFDALEDIAKARKAKGLEGWKKLDFLKDKLQGKQASHISFTTSYPGQEGSIKYLGSAAGNLHFVLGYANPGFHVAPYHFQLVDPNISDEEAAKMKHPTNPRYWKDSGLPIEDEGDFDEGKPHPMAHSDRTAKARAAERKTGAMMVQSGYGKYVAAPKEGAVYSLSNGHVYKWDAIKESFFAATQQKVTEAMNAEEETAQTEKSIHSKREAFSPFVYPMVRRHFPKPGSVFEAGALKILVKSDRVEFFDRSGTSTYVKVFDRAYDYFDLKKGGDIHPSILLQFAVRYLGVDRQELMQFVHQDSLPSFSKGNPSPGFDGLYGEYTRTVVVDGDTFRVVPRSISG